MHRVLAADRVCMVEHCIYWETQTNYYVYFVSIAIRRAKWALRSRFSKYFGLCKLPHGRVATTVHSSYRFWPPKGLAFESDYPPSKSTVAAP